MMKKLAVFLIGTTVSIAGCATSPATRTIETDNAPAIVDDISGRLEQLPQVAIDYDRSLLDSNQREVLEKLRWTTTFSTVSDVRSSSRPTPG